MTAEKQYKVIVSEKAYDTLSKIISYIALDSIEAAVKVKNEILKAMASLLYLPQRAPFLEGAFIPYNKYRKLVVLRRYLIIYQCRDEIVYVDYIVDCKQDYQWLVR